MIDTKDDDMLIQEIEKANIGGALESLYFQLRHVGKMLITRITFWTKVPLTEIAAKKLKRHIRTKFPNQKIYYVEVEESKKVVIEYTRR